MVQDVAGEVGRNQKIYGFVGHGNECEFNSECDEENYVIKGLEEI